MHSLKSSRCRLIPRLAMLFLAGGLWTTQARALEIVATDLFTLGAPNGYVNYTPYPRGSTAYGQVVGCGYVSGTGVPYHGVLWNNSSQPIDLTPAGFSESNAAGTNGVDQVGWVRGTATNNNNHAALWSGTPESFVNLQPVGFDASEAIGIGGGQQAGYVFNTTRTKNYAALWTGTADSFVNLNPAVASSSIAYTSDGHQQVGTANIGKDRHAALWSGTADSFVDLQPRGFNSSLAWGIGGGQQVGEAAGYATDSYSRAALWTGTADSYVDLNPYGEISSTAYATDGKRQVGVASFRAFLWEGTAESAVNLHALLPAGFRDSYAYYIEGNSIYGFAYDYVHNESHAILWTIVPEPASLSLIGLGALGLLKRRRNA